MGIHIGKESVDILRAYPTGESQRVIARPGAYCLCFLDGRGVPRSRTAGRDDVHPRLRTAGGIGKQGLRHFPLILERNASEIESFPSNVLPCLPKSLPGGLDVGFLLNTRIVRLDAPDRKVCD